MHYVNVSILIKFSQKTSVFYLNHHKFSIKSYVLDVYYNDSNTHPQHMILQRILKIIHFNHFDSDPRFPPFLLYDLGSLLYGDISVMGCYFIISIVRLIFNISTEPRSGLTNLIKNSKPFLKWLIFIKRVAKFSAIFHSSFLSTCISVWLTLPGQFAILHVFCSVRGPEQFDPPLAGVGFAQYRIRVA